jgi:hypothetical protein
MNAGVFSFSVATQNGKTYTLEFKNGLSDPAWAPLYSILGDGTIRTLSDTNAATAQRFYRINQSN